MTAAPPPHVKCLSDTLKAIRWPVIRGALGPIPRPSPCCPSVRLRLISAGVPYFARDTRVMSYRLAAVLLVVPALLGTDLHAQSTAFSEADAALYASAVEAADHRGHDYVSLLEEGHLRLEEDGTEVYTGRQVSQVLTREGVDYWGELSFGYAPDRQTFKLNWLRVVGPDGTVMSEGPEHQQESTPGADSGAPIYTDNRLLQMTIAGMAPGVILDYSYTIATHAPRLPGDVWRRWGFNGLSPVLQSRFTLDTPAEMSPLTRLENVEATARDRVLDGRRVRVWEEADVPAIELQSYLGFPNDIVKAVTVSGALTWDDVGAWYATLADGKYDLTPAIEAAHADQLRDARSWQDSLAATHRWVAQDFRYVSLALGDGAYEPRLPVEVFDTGFGDCKDKASLFVGLVRRMGLDARPVLVNSEGGVERDAPSLKQFDHMIGEVRRGGESLYFDLTHDLAPYGELPPSLQGEIGVVVSDDGHAEVVELPSANAERNRWERLIRGTLSRENRFVGSVTFTASGTEQYGLRQHFSGFGLLDEDEQATLLADLVRDNAWLSATVDSSNVFEGRDLKADVKVEVWFTSAGVLGSVGDQYTLNLPLPRFLDESLVSEVEAEGERVFPIDVEELYGPSAYRYALEIELPDGWRAQLPEDVAEEGAFGSYLADYRQVGTQLSLSRELSGTRGLQPPDSIEALTTWMSAIAADDVQSLTLSRGSSPGLIAAEGEVAPGRLPEMLLTESDLPDGASLASEGPAEDGVAAFMAGDPLESFSRTFAADEVVFTVGESQIVYMTVDGGVYGSTSEALRDIQYLDYMDLPLFFSAGLDDTVMPGASIGDTRELQLSGLGDAARGWVIQVVTPVTTLDLGIVLVARGRVGVTAMVVSAQGLRDEDVVDLLSVVDERIAADAEYTKDLDADALSETAKAPLAVVDSVGIALEEIVVSPDAYEGAVLGETTFERDGEVAMYRSTIQGKALAFKALSSDALSIQTIVRVFPDPNEAFKAFAEAEHADLAGMLRDSWGDDADMVDALIEGSDSELVQHATPSLDHTGLSRTAALRGGMKFDIDEVQFVHQQYVVSVLLSTAPGGSAPDDAAEIATDVEQRLATLSPQESGSAELDRRMTQAIRRVVAAEAVVDSLVDARAIEEAFAAVEQADLDSAPVSFAPQTWNGLCWWASLHGFAAEALPACDAALEPDPTNLAIRDSRALARALAGDLAGATADLEYIVDRSPTGDFLDTRAGWLNALLAGENPFTEEELKRLRGEG